MRSTRLAGWVEPSAAALVAVAFAFAFALAGCNYVQPRSCEREADANPTVRYTEGTAESGVYMSSPWDGELLYFPGGMHYALEHKLNATPRWIQAYLSFDDNGTASGMLAPAAGNQAVILGVDETEIRIANDSCVDYWLLVTAGVGDQAGAP